MTSGFEVRLNEWREHCKLLCWAQVTEARGKEVNSLETYEISSKKEEESYVIQLWERMWNEV